MTPEERIANFHEALKVDNQIWYDGLPCIFPNKDITVAIRKVWLIMHGEGKITRNMDRKEALPVNEAAEALKVPAWKLYTKMI